MKSMVSFCYPLLFLFCFFELFGTLFLHAQEQNSNIIEQLFSPENSKEHHLARQKWPYLPQTEKLAQFSVLQESLKLTDDHVRKNATWALSYLGTDAKSVVPLLLPLLQEKSLSLRQEVIHTLGEIAGRETMLAILPFLEDKDILSQKYALSSLYQIALKDEKAQEELIQILSSEMSWKIKNSLGQILVEVGKLDSNLFSKLSLLLKDPKVENRMLLVRVLGLSKLPNRESVQMTIQALSDVSPEVVHEAKMTLMRISPENTEAVASLRPLLQDEQKDIRYLVAWIFCAINKDLEDVFPLLVESLQDTDEKIRANSAFALGQILSYSSEVVPLLLQTIEKDPSRFVRQKGLLALFHLEKADTDTLKILDSALQDSDPLVRLYAQKALQKFRPAPPKKDDSEEDLTKPLVPHENSLKRD